MRVLLDELSRCPGAAEELLAYLLSQPPDASFLSTAAMLILWTGAPPPGRPNGPTRTSRETH